MRGLIITISFLIIQTAIKIIETTTPTTTETITEIIPILILTTEIIETTETIETKTKTTIITKTIWSIYHRMLPSQLLSDI
jgi:hypothetical protein